MQTADVQFLNFYDCHAAGNTRTSGNRFFMAGRKCDTAAFFIEQLNSLVKDSYTALLNGQFTRRDSGFLVNLPAPCHNPSQGALVGPLEWRPLEDA